MSTYYANDKYSAVLTSGYTVGQTTLYVSAVPNHVPTIIVAAKGTDNETIFEVTGKTTNSLTGVSRLRGANVDLDAQTPLTCLNNEEFINQFERATGAEVNAGTDDAKIVTPKAIADSLIQTGWTPARETWTYKSATQIYAAGDVTGKYQKGDKIKLTQTSTKYFYITAVSAYDSGNNRTTLTVTGGTDYSVANAAITNPYYSKAENPQGFPDWFNWTPTITASGSMTISDVSILFARFKINGKAVTITLRITFTTGGTASNTIYASLPVEASTAVYSSGAYVVATGAVAQSGIIFGEGIASARFRKYDSGNFDLTTNRTIGCSFVYEMA